LESWGFTRRHNGKAASPPSNARAVAEGSGAAEGIVMPASGADAQAAAIKVPAVVSVVGKSTSSQPVWVSP